MSWHPAVPALLFAAAVGAAVIVGAVLPENLPRYLRETAMMGTMWAAMYPFARVTWGRELAPWRYWAGLALGLPVGAALSYATDDATSKETSAFLLLVVAVTFVVLSWLPRSRRELPASAVVMMTAVAIGLFICAYWVYYRT